MKLEAIVLEVREKEGSFFYAEQRKEIMGLWKRNLII